MRQVSRYTVQATVLAMFGSVLCAAAFGDEEQRLTKLQSLGAIFRDVAEMPGSAFRLASPDILPSVHRVLQNTEFKRFHGRCILLLAFHGNKDDMLTIERYIHDLPKTDLDDDAASIIRVFPNAIAIMAKRKVDGADEKLQEMQRRAYWVKLEVPRFPGLPNHSPSVESELVALSVLASATLGQKAAQVALSESLKQKDLSSPERGYLESRIPVKSITGIARSYEASFREPLDPAIPPYLEIASNGDFSDPAPNPNFREDSRGVAEKLKEAKPTTETDLPKEAVKFLREEARAEYLKTMASVVKGDYDTVCGKVWDLARKVPKELSMDEARACAAELDKVSHIAVFAAKQGVESDAFEVSRKTLKDGKKTVQVIEAKCELSGTQRVGRQVQQNFGGSTVSDTGNLIVIMRKYDDKWYWHPFGW